LELNSVGTDAGLAAIANGAAPGSGRLCFLNFIDPARNDPAILIVGRLPFKESRAARPAPK
jgi:hypothetical protein